MLAMDAPPQHTLPPPAAEIRTATIELAMAKPAGPQDPQQLAVDSLYRCMFAGEVIKNTTGKNLTVTCPIALEEGLRITVDLRLPEKARAAFTTGRGQEELEIINRGHYFAWRHQDPEGLVSFRKAYPGGSQPEDRLLYWWEKREYQNSKDEYTPNGVFKPRFRLPANVADWSYYYQARDHKPMAADFYPVTVAVRNGRLQWFFDNMLLRDLPATAEVSGIQFQITLPPDAELRSLAAERPGTPPPDFRPVDIRQRCNAKGDQDLKRNQLFRFGGIPFEAPRPRPDGADCVDLGVSWFREGNLSSNEPPNTSGTFGGRWKSALNCDPTRLQFRLPNGHYDALFLLATCERRPDRQNALTAIFYRPGSGFPQCFTPVEKIRDDGALQVIRIPVRPDQLRQFADREILELELTGETHVYRNSPDPLHYSRHGAGLPPGIKVYAMTLRLAPLPVDITPESFGHQWVGNANPAYRVEITNNRDQDQHLELRLDTTSYNGSERRTFTQAVTAPAGRAVTTRFDLPLELFGWHRLVLTAGSQTYEHSLVKIRPRRQKAKTFHEPGFQFGIWTPGTLHYNLGLYDALRLAAPLGITTVAGRAWVLNDPSLSRLVKDYGLRNYYVSALGSRNHDLDSPDLEQQLLDHRCAPSNVNVPTYQVVFAEPGGISSFNCLPEYYGEMNPGRTPEQEAKFQDYKRILLNFQQAFSRHFPDRQILMPWGDPAFAIPFLEDPETRDKFDGIAYDNGFFDRLPEMQFHQCAIHRYAMFAEAWKKHRQGKPVVITIEGPCLGGVKEGALTADQQAQHTLRCILLLAAYGVDRFFASIPTGPEPASYWGEQHYGGGGRRRITLDPYPVVAASATLIRHLLDMQFDRWVDVGSHSTYCLQFRQVGTGKPLRVMWTVRGRRPVTMKYTQAYDAMDNLLPRTGLVLDQMPVFVYGAEGDVQLREPDHTDAALPETRAVLTDAGRRARLPAATTAGAPVALELGSMAELFPGNSVDADPEYVDSFPAAIRRFPGDMVLARSGEGLTVTLPPQSVDRGVMPYYVTLLPKAPIVIPGKAHYITMEVTAASDWGRVVYVLRDAKGEKFISVGTRNTWNNDDTPNASSFNFDGTRLVRFELPANLAWDGFREMGSTWWGMYGGDTIADLPLSIEKIHIERRQRVMYVNSLEPVSEARVTLGRLFVEYASASHLDVPPPVTMPPAPAVANPFNPVAALAADAALPATAITAVADPDHYYDGTRGVFHFQEVTAAAYYDIYLSLSPDGANAIKLGNRLRGSGQLVNGFLPDTDFYAFVVYYDSKGNHSQPSAPFKLNLKDTFGNK